MTVTQYDSPFTICESQSNKLFAKQAEFHWKTMSSVADNCQFLIWRIYHLKSIIEYLKNPYHVDFTQVLAQDS